MGVHHNSIVAKFGKLVNWWLGFVTRRHVQIAKALVVGNQRRQFLGSFEKEKMSKGEKESGRKKFEKILGL